MTALTDRLDALHLHASAPAGGVHAELVGGSQITVYLSTGFYRQTGESDLARRLEQLGRLLWVERTRAYRDTVARYGNGLRVVAPDPESDPADARFVEERSQLVATGSSPGGEVTIAVRGMADWRVTIAPGALRTLEEAEFTRAVEIAAARMITDQSQKILQAKAKAYGVPA